jgi:hypothetical protein
MCLSSSFDSLGNPCLLSNSLLPLLGTGSACAAQYLRVNAGFAETIVKRVVKKATMKNFILKCRVVYVELTDANF